ncbi:hypothetical protein [Streptomyces puniciscabiei]|uniref:hypothetical protein n=1 Tax=Streptomyces puniciscabiei TaxID=164348 RepID=UPI003322AFB1
MRKKAAGQGLQGAAAVAVLPIFLALTVSACDSSPSGPTAPEAGKRLHKDGKSLMDFLSTEAETTHVPYTIWKDAGTDEPCGDGEAKRAFLATARVPVESSQMKMTLFAGTVSGHLAPAYHLDTKGDNATSTTRVATTVVNRKSHTHITVVITPRGSQAMNYRLTGYTDCLRSK